MFLDEVTSRSSSVSAPSSDPYTEAPGQRHSSRRSRPTPSTLGSRPESPDAVSSTRGLRVVLGVRSCTLNGERHRGDGVASRSSFSTSSYLNRVPYRTPALLGCDDGEAAACRMPKVSIATILRSNMGERLEGMTATQMLAHQARTGRLATRNLATRSCTGEINGA
ncbi:hypothetical protein L226DRAFT_208617 [Lentinus tigrinus ALCF2SS1-7]|uniref:Uncharacterized protein n=1 Tax=Lentinus tigrinus ALCF2SS1-6 TaxID=1328759 RepID=A0A5C2S067_9APHY|nr:hypothetical protein L227DRAFT_243953 [Lentinus tigrinus ALCF2SS1-6]RPD71115.1 hypothetical protein L226DRAFT_208617 [Lentinus tigrinus ALCF2SS1-7]